MLTSDQVGYSRVLVTLSTRENAVFRPHADKFLKSFEKRILDRNDTVSSSYAAAMGYVARCASSSQVLRIASFAKELYFEADEERARIVSADLVQSVAKHAKDKFDSCGEQFLPFIYIARNDENPRVKTAFRETWNENVGGPRAVALYLKEIVSLASTHLASKRWILKHAAALSVADATQAIEKSQGTIGEVEGVTLWPALKTALSEKSWEGKEHVVKGFALFVEKGKVFWRCRSDVKHDISQVSRFLDGPILGQCVHSRLMKKSLEISCSRFQFWSTWNPGDPNSQECSRILHELVLTVGPPNTDRA